MKPDARAATTEPFSKADLNENMGFRLCCVTARRELEPQGRTPAHQTSDLVPVRIACRAPAASALQRSIILILVVWRIEEALVAHPVGEPIRLVLRRQALVVHA